MNLYAMFKRQEYESACPTRAWSFSVSSCGLCGSSPKIGVVLANRLRNDLVRPSKSSMNCLETKTDDDMPVDMPQSCFRPYYRCGIRSVRHSGCSRVSTLRASKVDIRTALPNSPVRKAETDLRNCHRQHVDAKFALAKEVYLQVDWGQLYTLSFGAHDTCRTDLDRLSACRMHCSNHLRHTALSGAKKADAALERIRMESAKLNYRLQPAACDR